MNWRRVLVLVIGLLTAVRVTAQDSLELKLGFKEYLAQVKQFHPLARQARLVLAEGEASVLRARGGFDPKLEIDYSRKQFKGTEYYERLNATFKIPTWYGVELKGQFDQNDGVYLNSDETLPDDGLYSAGLAVSVGQGMWIDKRMAALRQAKIYRDQSRVEQDLRINAVLYEAAMAYFNWLEAYRNYEVYEEISRNARERYLAVRKSAVSGVIAAIDSVEAKIAMQNRELSLEQARVQLRQSAMEVSNFLWLEGEIPVEIRDEVYPDSEPEAEVIRSLQITGLQPDSINLDQHPKIQSLNYKIDALEVDKQYKGNKLLPEIELSYNFLTGTPNSFDAFQTSNYKGGIAFRMPIFLRKERGDYQLAKLKLRNAGWDRDLTRIRIRNTLNALETEINSLEEQRNLSLQIVENYQKLLNAENRKFQFGESSIFLLNSRENSLINARLKVNEIQRKWLKSRAELFKQSALNPDLGS